MSFTKTLKGTNAKTRALRALGLKQLTAILCLCPSSQFLIHGIVHTSNPHLSSSVMRMCGTVTDLAEVSVDDICWSSPLDCCSHSIIEGHRVGQAGFALSEAFLAVSDDLVLHGHVHLSEK